MNNTVKELNNDIRELYIKYVQAANAHDFDAIARLINEDVIVNGINKKRIDVISEFEGLISAFPDLTWKIEHLVIEEDRIAARLIDRGTPSENSFFGNNPTKKTVEFLEFASYKVKNGLFVEMWYLIDVSAVKQQLSN